MMVSLTTETLLRSVYVLYLAAYQKSPPSILVPSMHAYGLSEPGNQAAYCGDLLPRHLASRQQNQHFLALLREQLLSSFVWAQIMVVWQCSRL